MTSLCVHVQFHSDCIGMRWLPKNDTNTLMVVEKDELYIMFSPNKRLHIACHITPFWHLLINNLIQRQIDYLLSSASTGYNIDNINVHC